MFKQPMKNKIYLFIILLFFSTNSFSEVVKEVAIEGNKRVNSQTIEIFGGFEIGQDLDTNDLFSIIVNYIYR